MENRARSPQMPAAKANRAERRVAEDRGVISMVRATDWRTWLIGTAVFAASAALVVLIASLLLGITFTMDLRP
jgi:hypothetical protein